MLNLLSLPYEVLSNIVESISFHDYFNLGRSCRQLTFLLEEERICKLVVQNKIPHSIEAREARKPVASGRTHARSFRRAAKRYDALASATPFVVATVGFCEDFLYCNGVLCYTVDNTVRILNPHDPSPLEIVISIPCLLQDTVCQASDNSKGTFLVLYYSHGIISCLFKTCDSDPIAWLIAFHLDSQSVLVVHELPSTDKIFVRHNTKYLYYGTHSELGTDGYKKWVIYGYEFATREWFEERIHLPDMVGSEIGSTVCFEFYNDFFYALSNQTSFEVEEIDWTSFYHVVRFPLNSPCKALLEKTENEKMWRRQHQEGPIDDRWTVLKLDVDESSGELNIVEARKEWYLGSSKSQRTYYTTPIVFPDLNKDEDLERAHSLASAATSTFPLPTNSSWVPAASSLSSSSASSSSAASASTSGTTTTATLPKSITTTFPDAQLAKLLRPDDHPHHIVAPARKPEHTHPGNDGSAQPTFTLAKSKIRTYHRSCSTFMDLVDDPLPTDVYGTQRLRLRAGTRHRKPSLRDEQGLLRKPSAVLDEALREMYEAPPIKYWPEAQHPDPNQRDENWEEVYRLLNPPSHLGEVRGTSDDRSLVYATGGFGKPQALIFVSFDPATKLEGLKRWGGLPHPRPRKVQNIGSCQKGLGEGPHIDGRAAGVYDAMTGVCRNERFPTVQKQQQTYVDVDEINRTVVVDRKGKGKANDSGSGPMVGFNGLGCENESLASSTVRSGEGEKEGSGRRCSKSAPSWIWQERAMHRDIGLGFYFGLEVSDRKVKI